MKKEINPAWISWVKDQISAVNDNGYLIFPDDVVFQIDKEKHIVNVICCLPSWIGSQTEASARSIFPKIGYQYKHDHNAPTTLDRSIDLIFEHAEKYLALGQYTDNILVLVDVIGLLYGLKKQNEDNKAIEKLIARKGKKIPLNPITIYGQNNLTISRSWIKLQHSVPDTAHRFDPTQKHCNMHKSVVFLFWQNSQEIKVGDFNPMIDTEEESFIAFFNQVKNGVPTKLWGRPFYLKDQETINFIDVTKEGDELKFVLYSKVSADIMVRGTVVIKYNRFIESLGHLFYNGELS